MVRLRTFGRQYVTPNVSANRLVELARIARPGIATALAHATLLARRAKPPRLLGVTLCIAVKTVSAFPNTCCQTERKKGTGLTKELCESRRGRPGFLSLITVCTVSVVVKQHFKMNRGCQISGGVS